MPLQTGPQLCHVLVGRCRHPPGAPRHRPRALEGPAQPAPKLLQGPSARRSNRFGRFFRCAAS
eukprot:9625157-Alexandrium_andersonii.AAC.1